MMLNNYLSIFLNFLYVIIGGVCSGLLATYIYQRRAKKRERTNIKISKYIARSYVKMSDGRTIPIFRIKISNETPQDAYDIKGYIRIRYRRRYLTINLTPVPILHGKNGSYASSDYQRQFPFKLSSIRDFRIKAFNDEKLLELYNSELLEFDSFAKEDTIVEVVIMSIGSISGGVLDVQMNTYTYDQLKTSIKNGRFAMDSLEIISNEDDSTPEELV